MTRNTIRRVEVAAPILDEAIRERLDRMFDTMMHDDEKGKLLTKDGNYDTQSINEHCLDSQELFYEIAYMEAKK